MYNRLYIVMHEHVQRPCAYIAWKLDDIAKKKCIKLTFIGASASGSTVQCLAVAIDTL